MTGPEGFSRGEIAKSDLLGAAAAGAVQAWRGQGHALAGVSAQQITANHQTHEIDATIGLNPGPVASFGATTVAGTRRVDPGFVAYMAGLKRNHVFDPVALEQARARLMRLGVFRSVTINEATQLMPDGTLPLNVVVAEQAPRKFSFGASVSSSDGLAVQSAWLHRNLFGKAESLRIGGTIGGIGANGGISDLNYSFGAAFTRPGIWGPDTNLNLSTTANREVISTIDTRNISLEAGLVRQLPDYSIALSTFATTSQTTDTGGFHQYNLAGFHIGGTRDKRDNVLDPSRGYYLSLTLTPFQEFNFGNTGLQTEFEARGYKEFGGARKSVLAGRFYIGSHAGVHLAQSPTDMLFFSGGGGSVRGYPFQSFGVTSGGVFSGGRSVVNFNAEIRTRLTGTLGLVGFLDAGLVGLDSLPDFATGFHAGAGVGLRYQTGLGPIRFDIARGLNLAPGDPGFAIYLGLGQAF